MEPKFRVSRSLWQLFRPDGYVYRGSVDRLEAVSLGRGGLISVRRLALSVRAGLLVLTIVLSALRSTSGPHLLWLAGIVVVAGLAAAQPVTGWRARIATTLEAIVTAVAVVRVGGPASPFLPFLLAPAFCGGIAMGVLGGLLPAIVSGAVFMGYPFASDFTYPHRDYISTTAEWFALASTVGVVAAWVRRLLEAEPGGTEFYQAAHRLLAQLRLVARQLPTGLDPVTIGGSLLDVLRQIAPIERGAVFVRSGGDRLVPIAYTTGTERVDWDLDVTGDNSVADAWASQQPQIGNRVLSRSGVGSRSGSSVVLPLHVGLRSFGIVGIETSQTHAYSPDAVERMERAVADAGVRLETALLFDEIRGLATVEERRRLAREIHDGIAQELVYVGYFIDGISAEKPEELPEIRQQLSSLRAELTRIISELRLSIFELRTEVERHGGLGAALSEAVRSIGTSSGMTVHLSLDEAPTRLPVETEAELLRIAQEALNNARKHSEAGNLWVTCQVQPPHARLVVEDDGVGTTGRRREGSYGLDIMRERASRLRASLDVRSRKPRGTVVEVIIGEPTSPAMVESSGEVARDELTEEASA